MKHVISITDVGERIGEVLETARKIRHERMDVMDGKVLGLLFEKPSLRTRVSFEMAVRQLGGTPIYLSPQEIQMGVREPIRDVANVLSGYVDMIAYRGFRNEATVELAAHSKVPVINALDDAEHPCQALADFLTILDSKGDLKGRKLAYLGDGNNVCNSLMLGAPYVGIDIAVATPKAYRPPVGVIQRAEELAREHGTVVELTTDPDAAVACADAVYTDTWVSMGSEEEKASRLKAFRRYHVDDRIMNMAAEDAVFLHCLPAHRGEEVSASVIDGPRSAVYPEAENRLHAQKALMKIISEDM